MNSQKSEGARITKENNFPDSWQEVKLGDKIYFEITMGQSPPGDTYNTEKKGVPFFQGKAEFGKKYPSVKKWTTKPSKFSKSGDILMSVRAPVGSVNMSNINCCIGRGLASIRGNNYVEKDFIYYFLKLNEIKIEKLGSGSTFKAITSKQLLSIKIPLPFLNNKPDLKEQERIVKILEKAEKVKERGKKAEELLDEYLKSVFNDMFYDRGFEEVSLGKEELYEEVFAGGDVQKVNFSKTKNEKFKFPIFTNGEKNKGLYGYTDKPRVIKPSITISARGTIGYSELREGGFYPAIRLIVLTPKKNTLNLHFLKYNISTIYFKLDGTSIPQLTIPMIKRYKMPLPPLLLQQKFSKIVEQVERMKENVKKTRCNSEELFNSLMQKAFRGEL